MRYLKESWIYGFLFYEVYIIILMFPLSRIKDMTAF